MDKNVIYLKGTKFQSQIAVKMPHIVGDRNPHLPLMLPCEKRLYSVTFTEGFESHIERNGMETLN